MDTFCRELARDLFSDSLVCARHKRNPSFLGTGSFRHFCIPPVDSSGTHLQSSCIPDAGLVVAFCFSKSTMGQTFRVHKTSWRPHLPRPADQSWFIAPANLPMH